MDVRIAIFRELLRQLRPEGGRYLDLATGHGLFAITAKNLGWEVTAVDVRTQRWPDDAGVEWIESDVRDFQIESGFDCIGLLGLLYHLELDDQLALLRRCAPAPLILDTHIAKRATIELGGYPGTIFDEGDMSAPTASWGNPTSFWPTRESLYRMLHASGYTSVYERSPFYLPDRTFWLCLSESYPESRRALVDEFARAAAAPPAKEHAALTEEEPPATTESAAAAPVPEAATATPAPEPAAASRPGGASKRSLPRRVAGRAKRWVRSLR